MHYLYPDVDTAAKIASLHQLLTCASLRCLQQPSGIYHVKGTQHTQLFVYQKHVPPYPDLLLAPSLDLAQLAVQGGYLFVLSSQHTLQLLHTCLGRPELQLQARDTGLSSYSGNGDQRPEM